MTLKKLIEQLREIGITQPNVQTTGEGNIYDALDAKKDIRYGVFYITQQTHREDEEMDYYSFSLFYVDRLLGDREGNRLQIQSIGKDVLSNIITTVCEVLDIDHQEITYNPFTQQFKDECAGMYATVTFECPKDYYCAETY